MGATVRCPCGQSFWVGDGDVGTRVPCPICNRLLDAVETPASKPASPHPPPPPPCQLCDSAGAKPVQTMRVMSILVFTATRRSSGTLCPDCTARTCLRDILVTGLLGWWGIPFGPFVTVVALVYNLRVLSRDSSLGGGPGILAGFALATLPIMLLTILAIDLLVPGEPPPDPRALTREMYALRANAMMEAGDYRGAARLYAEIITSAPDYAGARERLAQAHLGLGYVARAIEGYRGALALKPDDPGLKRALARALVDAGRPEEALPLTDDPAVRADALFALGRWPEVIALPGAPQARALATREPPTDPRLSELAAWFALDRGDYAAARRGGGSAGAALARVLALRLSGQPDEAQGEAARFLDGLDPLDERAPEFRALLEHAAGRMSAIEAAARADTWRGLPRAAALLLLGRYELGAELDASCPLRAIFERRPE